MTASEFKALFPEFSKASDDLVEARLTWAADRTPEDIWGDLRDQGIAWYAAHFLALLPAAKDMRKGEKPGESMYLRERQRLAKIVSSGYRSTGVREIDV